MKRKRNLLVVLLLVCAIGLGVGYAAVTDNLTVTGNTTIAEQSFEVLFTKHEFDVDNQSTAHTDVDLEATTAQDLETNNSNSFTFSVATLRDLGDKVTVTLDIVNFNDCAMTLETPSVVCTSDNVNQQYYTVNARLADQDGTLDAYTDGTGGDHTTLTIDIELVKVWTGATVEKPNYTDSFTVTVEASSAQ